MAELDLISLFVSPLERLGVDYFITGSVAAMLFGEPRTTLDIAAMRKIIGGQLDMSILMGWIAERGLTGTWQKTLPSGAA